MPLGTEVGPGDVVLHEDQAPPQKGHSPQFSVYVYFGQTAGWMKMPLGTEVDLGPGHIVLDGDSAPQQKGHSIPSFRSMSIVATVAYLPMSATAELMLDSVCAIGEFICDTPVHKGQRGVTVASNFGTNIAISAFLRHTTRI